LHGTEEIQADAAKQLQLIQSRTSKEKGEAVVATEARRVERREQIDEPSLLAPPVPPIATVV
jgi:hypothetical protein